MLAGVGYLPLVSHCHSVEPYLFGPSCCVLAFFFVIPHLLRQT